MDDAVNYIFQEMERNSLVIILPQIMREIEALYRENRKEYDEIARKLASERRENYRTKGTYF